MRSLGLVLLALLAILGVWYALGRHLTPDVCSLPRGTFEPDLHLSRQVAAIACPGVDLIRVWPLPVVQPWVEDEGEDRIVGDLAQRTSVDRQEVG